MGCRGCGGGSPAAAGSARWPLACSAGGLVTIGLAGGLRVCPTVPASCDHETTGARAAVVPEEKAGARVWSRPRAAAASGSWRAAC